MSTLIRHVHSLPPEMLDHYLGMGWRTTGQAVYNCNFLRIDTGETISVLPLRLRLEGHRFGKSMRKLLKKNLRDFRVVYGPARQMDAEVAVVNQAYMAENGSRTLLNLNYHVLGNHNRRALNTWETRVYDGQRLAAFSYFDLGKRSAYGKAGIYHPDYAHRSLGIFTLGLEVEFCRRRGMDYFYPGYVSDDNPMFDYKHRIGQMDFYDLISQSWLPYGSDPLRQRPLTYIFRQLQQIHAALTGLAGNEDAEIFVYPFLEIRYSSYGRNEFLDVPLFIHLRQISEDRHLILTYEVETTNFILLEVKESHYAHSYADRNREGLKNFATALIIAKVLCQDPNGRVVLEQYLRLPNA